MTDGIERFAGKVLAAHRQDGGCDVDGWDLQNWAVECGLLESREATESCGEDCACAVYTDFPATCYFPSEAGRKAVEAGRNET